MASAAPRNNTGRKVKGVRIACVRDQATGAGKLSTCDVPLDHDVFDIGEECPVSKLVGMPLLVCRARPTRSYAATRDSFGFDFRLRRFPNEIVQKLMICCDPDLASMEDGGTELLSTPRRWFRDVGSVIVVRKDCKPLYAHHVEILLEFTHTTVTMLDDSSDCWESFSTTTTGKPYFDVYPGPYPMAFDIRVDDFPRSAKCIIAQFTPGDFKDHYMGKRFSQKHDPEADRDLLELPSPFASGVKCRPNLKRNEVQRNYWSLSLEEKSRMVDNWRERMLLQRVDELESQRAAAAKVFERLRPRARSRA